MSIKFISIFKNTDKKNDKAPDYRLSAKVGDKFVEVGAGWIKESEKGKFISVKLSDPYTNAKGETRTGFELAEEKALGMEKEEVKPEIDASSIPF